MKRKLMEFRLKWYRPCHKVPEPGIEVLVRFRGQYRRYATMLYSLKMDAWVIPGHKFLEESGLYSTRDIFAWSALPQPTIPTQWEDEESK
jgi:hypothetical protein